MTVVASMHRRIFFGRFGSSGTKISWGLSRFRKSGEGWRLTSTASCDAVGIRVISMEFERDLHCRA